MNDNDSAVGGFLGLVMLGAAAFFGHQAGQNKAYRVMGDQQRDREIEQLKRELEQLRLEKK